MKGSNTLNSHHGERRSHRVDKMSGSIKNITEVKVKNF